eukprot:GHVT01094563.1.p1 GENE.GHVT01094563.1~~GHVT01094563.1.p1  ORF type:complete len:544 (+),score=163.98 GHVT01094563.1:50-1633(+)
MEALPELNLNRNWFLEASAAASSASGENPPAPLQFAANAAAETPPERLRDPSPLPATPAGETAGGTAFPQDRLLPQANAAGAPPAPTAMHRPRQQQELQREQQQLPQQQFAKQQQYQPQHIQHQEQHLQHQEQQHLPHQEQHQHYQGKHHHQEPQQHYQEQQQQQQQRYQEQQHPHHQEHQEQQHPDGHLQQHSGQPHRASGFLPGAFAGGEGTPAPPGPFQQSLPYSSPGEAGLEVREGDAAASSQEAHGVAEENSAGRRMVSPSVASLFGPSSSTTAIPDHLFGSSPRTNSAGMMNRGLPPGAPHPLPGSSHSVSPAPTSAGAGAAMGIGFGGPPSFPVGGGGAQSAYDSDGRAIGGDMEGSLGLVSGSGLQVAPPLGSSTSDSLLGPPSGAGHTAGGLAHDDSGASLGVPSVLPVDDGHSSPAPSLPGAFAMPPPSPAPTSSSAPPAGEAHGPGAGGGPSPNAPFMPPAGLPRPQPPNQAAGATRPPWAARRAAQRNQPPRERKPPPQPITAATNPFGVPRPIA